MKKLFIALITLSVMLGLATGQARAAQQTSKTKDVFGTHAQQINSAAESNPAVMKEALHQVSVETGVAQDKVQAQHQRHPQVGPAGLLVANVLAAETKKAPETFITEHLSGKSWQAIAKENNVSPDRITTRMDRVWKAIEPTAQKAK